MLGSASQMVRRCTTDKGQHGCIIRDRSDGIARDLRCVDDQVTMPIPLMSPTSLDQLGVIRGQRVQVEPFNPTSAFKALAPPLVADVPAIDRLIVSAPRWPPHRLKPVRKVNGRPFHDTLHYDHQGVGREGICVVLALRVRLHGRADVRGQRAKARGNEGVVAGVEPQS